MTSISFVAPSRLADIDWSVRVCFRTSTLFNCPSRYCVFLPHLFVFSGFFLSNPYLAQQSVVSSDSMSNLRQPLALVKLTTEDGDARRSDRLMELDMSEIERLIRVLEEAKSVVEELESGRS